MDPDREMVRQTEAESGEEETPETRQRWGDKKDQERQTPRDRRGTGRGNTR